MGKHCGYQGEGFIAKLSRAVITDKPCGIDISCHCEAHDRGWSIEANKQADLKLKKGIEKEFKAAKMPLIGKVVALIYFVGVRLGGIPIKIKYLIDGFKNNR